MGNQKLESWKKSPEAAKYMNRKTSKPENKKNTKNSNSGGKSGGGVTPTKKNTGNFHWKSFKGAAQMVCALDKGKAPTTAEEMNKLMGLQQKRTNLLIEQKAPQSYIDVSKSSTIVWQKTAQALKSATPNQGTGSGKK